jgi:ribosomal protein S18 acetylase RimI-like enzyme
MQVALPDGYAARPYRGPVDHPGMNRVRNDANLAAGADETATVEAMDNTYANLENCDVANDVIVVERDGETVAYGRATWTDPLDDERTYELLSWALPAHADGLPWLGWWLEQRLHRMAADHGRTRYVLSGLAPLRPAGATADTYRWAEVLTSMGMEVVRHELAMLRTDLHDAVALPLPAGTELRPVTGDHLRAIWESHSTAFLDHPGAVVAGEHDWQEFLGFPHRDESLWKVAWAGDEVVGQVRSFVNAEENARFDRRRGYTEYISTARPWRGRGVAAALLSASIVELRERGFTEAALDVMAENTTGALHLYTKLGFVPYADTGIFRRLVER